MATRWNGRTRPTPDPRVEPRMPSPGPSMTNQTHAETKGLKSRHEQPLGHVKTAHTSRQRPMTEARFDAQRGRRGQRARGCSFADSAVTAPAGDIRLPARGRTETVSVCRT